MPRLILVENVLRSRLVTLLCAAGLLSAMTALAVIYSATDVVLAWLRALTVELGQATLDRDDWAGVI